MIRAQLLIALCLALGLAPLPMSVSAAGACNDNGCTSGAATNHQRQRTVEGAINSLGDFLQEGADRQAEQERQAREAQNAQEAARLQDSANRTSAFDQYVNNLGSDNWEAEAAGKLQGKPAASGTGGSGSSAGNTQGKGSDCNCRKITGACQATVSHLKKTGKTGYSFVLQSTENECSRVSYFIDNTPYLAVLNHRSSSIEQVSSQRPLSLNQLQIERCEICARQ